MTLGAGFRHRLTFSQLIALHKEILSSPDQFPLLASSARLETERDIDYILTGMDKLYTVSDILKREQVKKSNEMAETRFGNTVTKIRSRIEKRQAEWIDRGKPIVKRASDALDGALGHEWTDLQRKVNDSLASRS